VQGGFSYSTPEHSPLRRALIRTVETIGGQRRLARLYESRLARRLNGESFYDTAIRLMALDVQFNEEALARIPANGPVIILANHPFGILDGIVLTWLALKMRLDIKVLAHSVLLRVPETHEHLLPVDFSGTDLAVQTNLETRSRSVDWLKQGHAVGLFPGGGVATSETWAGKRALDLPWAPFTAKLIRSSGATVVPLHFSGQNSRLFQIASHLSLTLRTSLLMHETARRIGTRLDVAIGEPIPPEELAAFSDRSLLLNELRRRTTALGRDGRDDWMRSGRMRMPKPLTDRRTGSRLLRHGDSDLQT
jgi:putative hemolysin